MTKSQKRKAREQRNVAKQLCAIMAANSIGPILPTPPIANQFAAPAPISAPTGAYLSNQNVISPHQSP